MSARDIILHPLKSDGTVDESINLHPYTTKDNLLNENGNPFVLTEIPLTSTAGKVLKSTAVSGVAEWSDETISGGDVTGPVSSGNNHVAVFDGTTGKIIKDSLVEINNLASKDYIQANVSTLATESLQQIKIGNTVYSVLAAQTTTYKGTLGIGGTIQSLPTASLENSGWQYIVVTAGTYESQSASIGDSFISNGSEWNLLPAGSSYQPLLSTGTGITLANNVISVDTAVIQPLLSATNKLSSDYVSGLGDQVSFTLDGTELTITRL